MYTTCAGSATPWTRSTTSTGCCASKSGSAARRSSTSASGTTRSARCCTGPSSSIWRGAEMPLTLYVDRGAWRHHQMCVVEAEPDLVPVAKGNGYGFTVPVLARAAAGLGVDQLAVGTPDEAAAVLGCFGGDVIILEAY